MLKATIYAQNTRKETLQAHLTAQVPKEEKGVIFKKRTGHCEASVYAYTTKQHAIQHLKMLML